MMGNFHIHVAFMPQEETIIPQIVLSSPVSLPTVHKRDQTMKQATTRSKRGLQSPLVSLALAGVFYILTKARV